MPYADSALKRWRDNNPEMVRLQRRKQYLKNPEYCRKKSHIQYWNRKNSPFYNDYLAYRNAYTQEYNKINPEKRKEWTLKTQKSQRLKALFLVSRGDIRCVKCGCDDQRLLEINHKNGGGSKEKKQNRWKDIAAAVLRYNRNIDDLELLCKACNILHYIELKWGRKGKVVWEVD